MGEVDSIVRRDCECEPYNVMLILICFLIKGMKALTFELVRF